MTGRLYNLTTFRISALITLGKPLAALEHGTRNPDRRLTTNRLAVQGLVIQVVLVILLVEEILHQLIGR